ncbi:MAG: hypothetical protein ABJP86_15265, partial [Flavobacteriaceae bacterium]
VTTPGGRVYYMGAYSEIPDELDFTDMVELGSSATINSFEENPYVWNGISSTLTKYEVADNLEIKVLDVLSFVSTGLSGGFGLPTFVSDTKAYFFALSEGKVIEFNPTTMKITETINVDVLDLSGDSDINTHTYSNIVTADGTVILPIGSYPDGAPDKFPQYAELAVFDPTTKTVSYVRDTRMSMGYDTYAKGNDGSFYYRPSKNTAIAEDYSTLTGYPTTGGLLKIQEDGTFDPDFFVDLKEVLNAHSVNSVVYVHDSKALVQYMDASFIPPTNPDDWYSEPTSFALVDLNAKTFEPFTTFEQHGTVYTVGQMDGVEYYGNLGDSSSGQYSVLKQNGPTDFEIVSEAIGGSLIYIGKLR